MHLKWERKIGQTVLTKIHYLKFWSSGRPDLARKRKKEGRCQNARWHFGHHLSHLRPSGLEGVPEYVLGHNTSYFGHFRERKKREKWKQASVQAGN